MTLVQTTLAFAPSIPTPYIALAEKGMVVSGR
jgi:hypothetical protein